MNFDRPSVGLHWTCETKKGRAMVLINELGLKADLEPEPSSEEEDSEESEEELDEEGLEEARG